MTGSAPAASAAVTSTVKSATVSSAASLAAAVAAVAGVIVGMKRLEPYFDEQEERELRPFRNASIATVLTASLVLPFTVTGPPPRWLAGAAVFAFTGILIALHALWLPRILDRRWRWECEVNLETARQHRRAWMYQTIAHAAGAMLGGFSIMLILMRGF
jgi:hypothetical protein